MLHGLVINWSSSAIETSRYRVNVFSFITVSIMRILGLREFARTTARIALEFAPDYAFGVSLLLTPLCCDDIHDVTPRVSALARCDITSRVCVLRKEILLQALFKRPLSVGCIASEIEEAFMEGDASSHRSSWYWTYSSILLHPSSSVRELKRNWVNWSGLLRSI
ncbi:hypothetical protein Tco_0657399 [Tanacetum coccineum]|uniref:Uncharacterized protein n=1 Tax=Tanacetum coccineum TaxID=301880 RepID=A0ABQ4XC53_9ASTR